MKTVDIMEVLVTALEEKILGEWRHEGFNGGWSTNYANFAIDGKEYVIRIEEVEDGQHWSDKLKGADR